MKLVDYMTYVSLNPNQVYVSRNCDGRPIVEELGAQAEQFGSTYFMPLSELCDPICAMMNAEVGVSRLVHDWEYDSRQEMGHVCIRNELCTRYMDSLDLTSYFKNVCLGWQNLVKEFQSESDSSIVTKDFIEPFGWGACHFFLQHDIQGITRPICEKLEDKAKVGQLSSNKVHNAIELFMDAKHRLVLDLWLLPPDEKEKGDIFLFVRLYDTKNEEPCLSGGLFVKASHKPSEVLRKLNIMAVVMPYKQMAEFIRGIFNRGPTFGVFHSNLQRCSYSYRSNSPFKSSGFAPIDAERIVWILILWTLAMRPRSLCCFRKDGKPQQPLLEVVVGKSAELPHEILIDIFALLDTPDLVRAGSVCGSWNLAYSSICSFGQCKWPQTPCLIYTSESADDNVAFLHSLAEKRVYKLTLPEPPIHRRYLIGSSNGWLVTADEHSEMHLVNPITSEQISLPSVTTIEQVTPIFDENGILCKYRLSRHTANGVVGPPSTYSLSTLRDHLFHKTLVFFDTSAGSYMVVLIHNPFGQLSFARLGDEKWTWLPPHSNYEDCIYKDDVLYAVTLLGQIITFDVSGSVVTTKIIMDRKDLYGVERVYIVQDPLGDLLLVRRPEAWIDEAPAGPWPRHGDCASQATFGNRTWRIAIYKVCIASRKLLQINSLDDHVLFLGHSQSLCLRAEENPQVKPNHVYFTDDSKSVSLKCKLRRRHVIGMLNLKTKIMDEIASPQPWSSCRAPLLIIPNPRKMDQTFQSRIQHSK